MADHARFAPSAAHRWANCPGSTLDLEGYSDESDEYATEGTAAHALLKHCLDEGKDPFDQHLDGVRYNGVLVDADMAETVGRVVDGIRDLMEREPYELTTEERVHAPAVHEDCWGTLDMSLYSERKRHLYIIDFKYGAGILVRAKDNEQIAIYGEGKLTELRMLGCEVSRITLVICQPRHRLHEYLFDLHEITPDQLAKEIKRLNRAARDGKTLKAGDWCRLCPKSGNCPTQDEYVGAAMPHDLHSREDYPALIESRTPEQLSEILDRADDIKHWLKAVEAYAFETIKLGGTIPGYRLRDVTRHRQWTDKDVAEKQLHAAHGDVIYLPREMRSPAQMEKIKGSKNLVAALTMKPPAGQALAKDDDL
jgi:Protein of unknown function (DUF2800)